MSQIHIPFIITTIMSLGEQLENALSSFENATHGVLGTSVISSTQALMMAGSSQNLDRNIIQGMSIKFLKLAKDTLESIKDEPTLESVTVEENNHMIFIRPITEDYYLVAITDKSEIAGLRISNLDVLTSKLNRIINGM